MARISKNLTGVRFGALIPLTSFIAKRMNNWICICDCGKTATIRAVSLINGNTRTCGDRTEHRRGVPHKLKEDLVGQKFGFLTVASITSKSRKRAWLCVCDCGESIVKYTHALKVSNIVSCGCRLHRSGPDSTHWKSEGNISFPMPFFNSFKRGAKVRGLEFAITPADIEDLFEKQGHKCALSGVPIGFGDLTVPRKLRDVTASIDRIESSLGYTRENIQLIHKDINIMKMDNTQDYFIKICKLVADNNPSLTS